MASRTITLAINGMHCASCQTAIETALGDLPGISKVAVNVSAGKAQVSYDPSMVRLAEMARTVADVGYEVGQEELTLKVTGMSCASCASKIEAAVAALEGVAGVVVNVPAGDRLTTVIQEILQDKIYLDIAGEPGRWHRHAFAARRAMLSDISDVGGADD